MGAASTRRLWRLRKLHQHVDARLRPLDSGEAELQFFYNGQLAVVRACPTIDAAMTEAAARRVELEREGWMFHW